MELEDLRQTPKTSAPPMPAKFEKLGGASIEVVCVIEFILTDLAPTEGNHPDITDLA